MNPAIIDVQGQGWTEIEDPSRSTMVNGDFEIGGSPPAGYIQLTANCTQQPFPRPGSLGSFCGQVGYDGASANGYMIQIIAGLPTTAKVHYQGWWRSDGVAQQNVTWEGALGTLLGTPSAVWSQWGGVVVPSGGSNIYLYAGNLAAGRYAQFDDVTVTPFVNRTPNIGSLGGRLDMGDGLTPATLPTRTPNTTAGFAFNGSQYLQWMSPVTQSTFTYCALVQSLSTVLTPYLIDARAGGGTGYMFLNEATRALTASSGTIYVDDVATNVLPYGKVALVSCVGMTINAPSKIVLQSKNDLLAGQMFPGNVLGQILVPGTMTPRQMRDWKYRLMARSWT